MNLYGPKEVSAYDIVAQARRNAIAERQVHGVWRPARSIGAPSVFDRCVMAWKVFTGRADCLVWPGQE